MDGPAQAAPDRPAVTTAQATVTVNLAGKTAGGIGGHFMGLSFESGTLSNGMRYDAVGRPTPSRPARAPAATCPG
jgi:hypothetical protein